MLYDDKAPDILKKYAVKAFPTFIITDVEGAEVLRQVGAPFQTPKDAIKWFGDVADGLDNLPKYEAAHEKDPENLDAALKLAETYSAMGKSDKALPLYEKLAAKVKQDDKRWVDIQLKYADGLLATMTQENQKDVGGKIAKVYEAVLPGLVKGKDERAIEPGILNARIKSFLNEDHEGARKELKALVEAFPKHERVKEIKYWAAAIAQKSGDSETAKAEYEALVKEGPEEDRYVKAAKSAIARMK